MYNTKTSQSWHKKIILMGLLIVPSQGKADLGASGIVAVFAAGYFMNTAIGAKIVKECFQVWKRELVDKNMTPQLRQVKRKAYEKFIDLTPMKYVAGSSRFNSLSGRMQDFTQKVKAASLDKKSRLHTILYGEGAKSSQSLSGFNDDVNVDSGKPKIEFITRLGSNRSNVDQENEGARQAFRARLTPTGMEYFKKALKDSDDYSQNASESIGNNGKSGSDESKNSDKNTDQPGSRSTVYNTMYVYSSDKQVEKRFFWKGMTLGAFIQWLHMRKDQSEQKQEQAA